MVSSLRWMGIGLVLWSVFLFNDVLAQAEFIWTQQLLLALGCAFLWAMVTPLIRALARGWPLDETFHLGRIAIHLCCSLVFSLLMTAAMTTLFLAAQRWFLGKVYGFYIAYAGLAYYFVLVKVVFYWAVVATDSALHYMQRFRREAAQAEVLAHQLGEAQLKVLQAQLQPHFLFNTLNSLAALIRTGDHQAAQLVIVDLGDLLRRALHTGRSQWVPLSEEMVLVEKYIAIEKIRFQERATFEIVVDETLSEILIPSLVIQPLVENAVRHGIEQAPEASWVRLEVLDNSDRVTVRVLDDGPGFPVDWALEQHSGMGMGHTFRRMKGLFGASFDWRVNRGEAGGAIVEMEFPKRNEIGDEA